MTLNANAARNEYTATASQTIFNYTFKIYETTDLDVYVTPAGQECSDSDLTTSYSVAGVGAEDGGSITLTTPTSAGDLVTIVSSIPTNRTTDYQNSGDFRPDTVNDDFDRTVSLVKQAEEAANRSLVFADCLQNATSLSLPTPESERFVRWKNDLSGLENTDPPSAVVTDTTLVSTRDYGTLRAVTGQVSDQVVSVAYRSSENDGGGGPFRWDDSDLSTEVAADTQSGIYVAPNSDPSGASGAWVRSGIDNAINVLWFGVTEAASSNTVAYTAAVASGYKHIYIPDGTYAGTLNLGNNQILEGTTAKNGTVLIPPPGGTYVIGIDATSTPRQHCQVNNISLRNPNAVANCDGLFFNAADKNDINDQHSINNMFIKDFRNGINVLGRQILCTYRNIEVTECSIGMSVASDPANYAYNLNTFISCKFATCTAQGIKITGFNTANKFISPNIEGNNTLQVAGVAGMDVENAEGICLDNPYFELNGAGMAVDTGTPTNNSMGLKLTGSRCFNLRVGGTGWMVQSGIMIYIDPAVTCWGGIIENQRFLPETNGWSFYCDGAGLSDRPGLCYDVTNYTSGTLEIVQQGTGQFGAHVRQSSTVNYLTSAATLDLLGASKFTCSNASGFTITTIDNRVPGCELWIHNRGAGNITLDSALMASGADTVITQGNAKTFMVAGFPDAGELVPVTGQIEARTGTGSPSGSVTPTYIGEEWLDTTGNAWYKSYGTGNTDWQAL
jgi:hypothetical protein